MDANKKILSERLIGCAFAVSNELGTGFLERAYESAPAVEMLAVGIEFDRQSSMKVHYRGAVVGNYIADFVVEDKLIVEIKALSKLTSQHDAQIMNYLKATRITVGLLLNFGTPRVGVKHLVVTYNDNAPI